MMNWKFEPKTGSYTYNEYNGAYGYSVMPYTNAYTGASGYTLYFKNAWRTDRPLGEYIDTDANLTAVFAPPSMGLWDDLIFNTYEEACVAAEKHKAKDDEPMSYENDLDDVEEMNARHND